MHINTHNMNVYGGMAVGAETLFGLGSTVYVAASGEGQLTICIPIDITLILQVYSTPSTQSGSNYPPYVKLTYIQCNNYEADAPNLTSAPEDRSIEYGYYTGESLSWTPTDANPDYYTLDLMGSGRVAGSPIGYQEAQLLTISPMDLKLDLTPMICKSLINLVGLTQML